MSAGSIKTAGGFITFEGGEGSGKSTQIRKLFAHLKATGKDVLMTREPGGSPRAEKIRDILLNGDVAQWDPHSEYLLFSVGRRAHLQDVIIPHLQKGGWVLCDRFYDSSLAYQHFGHGLSRRFMDDIYHEISAGCFPDLTFYLDIDPRIGLPRALKRPGGEDRFESMGLAFHERVRAGYHQLITENPDRFVQIDGQLSIDGLFQEILAALPETQASPDLVSF